MTNKFDIWDSKEITSTLEYLAQVTGKINELLVSSGNNTTLEDLPPSVLPTSMLYTVSVYFEAMYDKLKQDRLLKTGNPKQTNGIH